MAHGKPRYWGETCASATFSNRDPSLGSNPVSAMTGKRLTASADVHETVTSFHVLTRYGRREEYHERPQSR